MRMTSQMLIRLSHSDNMPREIDHKKLLAAVMAAHPEIKMRLSIL